MIHQPATPKYPHMLHGGDYNPEQWKAYPEILKQDIVLMKKANINCVSLGIFSWAQIEPEENQFDFEFLDKIINTLYENQIYTILATPSGARPHWLAEKYPEVLRTDDTGRKALFGQRENHCYTSPAYRERVRIIDTKLAGRYANHPAVILWHISNEFCGECHCKLCQEAFRNWLKEKYHTLDNLNHAWWSHFWSHTYTDWKQIHSPSPIGETAVHGLNLDWKRFVTYQSTDFMNAEIDAVKAVNPEIPVTTNMMGMYAYGLDYTAMSRKLDVISWDCYPEWHALWGNANVSIIESLSHDMMRALKQRSFLLMECTPGTTNWRTVSKLKKPGMHELSIVNAVAHGADSGLYFQIRQSRGSCEKFHSAVISHTGTENTRTFREVSETGALLQKIESAVYGTSTPAKTAIIFDAETKWALDVINGPRNAGLNYFGEIQKCYRYFWKNGINTDIVDQTADFSGYELVIAPMLYLFRDGIQDKLRKFVENGGTLVTTAFTGIVNETDLCFLGEATPEKLSDVMGFWIEETDALYDGEHNALSYHDMSYELSDICEILHPTTCKTLGTYQKDYYQNQPALTLNAFGRGLAYHIASCAEEKFLDDFFAELVPQLNLQRAMETTVPENCSLTWREDDKGRRIIFIQNYEAPEQEMLLDNSYEDILTGEICQGSIRVKGFSFRILRTREENADA
ncbi:MAG: beta-galactosidase [Ruminococcus sp.]|nr:beta-galactosidase [Ruminococcus sp.]